MLEAISREEFRRAYSAAHECLNLSFKLVQLAIAKPRLGKSEFDNVSNEIKACYSAACELQEWLAVPEVLSCLALAVLNEPEFAGERHASCHHLAFSVASYVIEFFGTGSFADSNWEPIESKHWPLVHKAFDQSVESGFDPSEWICFSRLLLTESIRASDKCKSETIGPPLLTGVIPPQYRDGGTKDGEPLTSAYIANQVIVWGISAGALKGIRRAGEVQVAFAKVDSEKPVIVHNYSDLLAVREKRARRNMAGDN